MSKHTPGPWTQIPGSSLVIQGSAESPHNWGGFRVATAHAPSRKRAEAHANARLIAETPELLEIAKQALETWEFNERNYGVSGALAARARAVIARVEGDDR